MTTTVQAAPLTYTYTESINLVNQDRGSTFTKQIDSSIMEYSRVVRNIPQASGFMTVASFASSPLDSGSQFDLDEVKFVRITNLDTNHNIAILFKPLAGTSMSIALEPGHTFMMGSPKAFYADSETVPFRDLAQIDLRAVNGNIDVEVVVASQ